METTDLFINAQKAETQEASFSAGAGADIQQAS